MFLKENPDFYQDLEIKKGEYIESHVFDHDGNAQGQAIWLTRAVSAKVKEGIWIESRLVACSDSHLSWWVKDGEGKSYEKIFHLHLCTRERVSCRKTQGDKDGEFHSDYFRILTTNDVISKKVTWLRSREVKTEVEAEISRLEGQKDRPSGKAESSKKRALAETTDEELEADELPAEAEGKGSGPRVKEDLSNRLKGSPLRHVFGWNRDLLFEYNPTKRRGNP